MSVSIVEPYPDTGRMAVAARLGFVLVVFGVITASLAPATIVPRMLYSYHLEHFAAFYLVALVTAAALPRVRLRKILIWLMVFSALLECGRVFLGARELSSSQNLFADVGGMWAALAPIVIGRFRDRFRAPASTA